MLNLLAYTVFPRVLNMSLTAGIVILCVMLVRLMLRKAPKAFSYALWSVVLFRLLCPVSLTAGFSLLGAMDLPAQPATVHTTRVEYLPVEPFSGGMIQRPVTQTTDQEDGQGTTGDTPTEPAVPTEPSTSPGHQGGTAGSVKTDENHSFALAEIAAICWLVGVLGMICYGMVAYFRLRRQLAGAVLTEEDVWIADYIPGPFVIGILRPRVYLPSTLTRRELAYILPHEKYHIHRGDHIVKLISFAVLCIHWFNPFVWAAFLLSGKDMEMSCDEAVLKQLGPQVRAAYSASLLSLATGRRIIAGMPLAFGEGDTKSRIRNLVNWKKPKGWVVLTAAVLCVAVTIACAANPMAAKTKGTYTSMEDFAKKTMDSAKMVSYYPADGGDQVETKVLDTKLAFLYKEGERAGLAPEGTLELWQFHYLVKIGIPPEKVSLVDGMSEEDGWFDFQGQGGENVVALRYEDGSYDVLDRQQVNDNLRFHGSHRNVSEALWDWYVTSEQMDLPLYVETWTLPMVLGSEETDQYQVNLYEGDGWRIYLPAAVWSEPTYTRRDACRIRSNYETGSFLSVSRREESAEALRDAFTAKGYAAVAGENGRYVAGIEENGYHRAAYCVPAEQGSWLIETEWEEAGVASSEYTAVEPVMLQAMAESFTVDPACTRTYPSPEEIREMVNKVFVGGLSWDDTWESMGEHGRVYHYRDPSRRRDGNLYRPAHGVLQHLLHAGQQSDRPFSLAYSAG